MKRTISILLAMGMVVGILSGGDAVTQEAAGTPVQQTDEPQIQMDETDGSDDMVTLSDLTESHPIANPPCVMVDGILYQDTGFVDSMVGCGNMDGVIDSAVDATELPSENNQSNFGTGMSYQRSSEGQLIVYVDEEPRIFRDINSTDTTIPEEVLHFTAKVKEIYSIENVQVVDKAEISYTPSNINHKKDIIIFAFIGAVVSIIYVLVSNMLDTTVKTAEEIEKEFKLPVIASIPIYNAEPQRRNGGKR